MDVNLRGEVAAGVYLVIHCEGGVLRVAQVVSGICDIDALRDALLVVTACVDVLAFLAVADGRCPGRRGAGPWRPLRRCGAL